MEPRAADLVEAVFREERGRLLAALAARFGDFDLAEEVAQEAVEAALTRWPVDGVPEVPLTWLLTTARRRAVDRLRRQRTEAQWLAVWAAEVDRTGATPVSARADELPDERLTLFFTCCHPALPLEAQVALTLRFLAGMTTPEVAAALLVPVPTMQQRIVRAKRKITQTRIPFRMPDSEQLRPRLAAVLAVVYLLFTKGYANTQDEELIRSELSERMTSALEVLGQRDEVFVAAASSGEHMLEGERLGAFGAGGELDRGIRVATAPALRSCRAVRGASSSRTPTVCPCGGSLRSAVVVAACRCGAPDRAKEAGLFVHGASA